ncbi:MAG: 50S ribosomal protein L15 [Alphaproteobacteria bacterium]|jgi:large subunit ribosomal protein L15|nr:50S ribosomal protein L15 [Alphaproteobacteria bacterium]
MRLNQLRDNAGARRRRQRVGRGIGSGRGKNTGTGHKGHKSRSGGASRTFEGGQMPIYRRLPKRGFKNALFRTRYQLVNLDRLQTAADKGKFAAGTVLDGAALAAAGVVREADEPVKLLGRGELQTALTLDVAKASPKAVAAVEAAGGKVTVREPAGEAASA